MPTASSDIESDLGRDERSHDVTGTGAAQESTVDYVRSPRDALRLASFLLTGLVVLGVTLAFEDAVLGFELDLVNLFDFLGPQAERVLHGAVVVFQVAILVALLGFPLATGRYRLVGYLVVAGVAAVVVMAAIGSQVDRQTLTELDNLIAERAGLDDSPTDAARVIALLSALFVVMGPWASRRWRRAGAVAITAVALVRLLVATRLPADLLLALPVGATCGAAVLLAFGRPDRRPTIEAIASGLADAGLSVTEIHPATVDARGSTPYFATLTDERRVFVKILGADERAADLLFRLYRYLRVRNVGDDRPFSSLRRTIEHEALVALMARDIGVRTPRLLGVVTVGTDSMLLAFERIDGPSLDAHADDDMPDELLQDVWEQVRRLRGSGIAHRDLRRANVVVAGGEEPWLIDFGFAEVAVAEEILDTDVAQLLASLTVETDPGRTVASAIAALGPDAVAAALPRLQIRALSGATQTALEHRPELLDTLRREVMEQCGIEDVHFAELERVRTRTLVTVAVLALATYFVLPQLGDLPGIVDQVRDANWAWAPPMFVAAALTYVAATMGIAGSVPRRLPAMPLFAAQVASSFTTMLAPATVGGMALNIRFFQKQGLDRAVATAGVGLNTVAGFVGHLLLIVVFLLWAGPSAFGSFELPDPHWFLVGAAVAVVLAAIGAAIPWIRHLFAERVLPTLRRGARSIASLAGRPGKLALLFGGSILITFGNLVTLYFGVEAFGGGLTFAAVGAVFLVGSAIATVAPTPGGLGAMEAALIGGLVAAGLDHAVAVPAVFLFRLFTFWLPILPGWLAFTWLQHGDYV